MKGWNKIMIGLLCMAGTAFSSCNHSDKKQGPSATTAPAPPPKIHNENTELRSWFHNPNLVQWSQRMKKKDSHFSVSHFSKAKEEPLQEQPGKPYSEEEWGSFQSYFIFSPDHTLAIDLYSYGNVPGKKPGDVTELEGGDPDSEVSLVNVKNKTKTRLLFAGPGTTFQQAAWIGDSIVLITGMSDANAENEIKPVLWKINLKERTLNPYEYRGRKSKVQTQNPK